MGAVFEMLKKHELDVLGVIPKDLNLIKSPINKDSDIVQEAIKQFYFRLNLPQKKV